MPDDTQALGYDQVIEDDTMKDIHIKTDVHHDVIVTDDKEGHKYMQVGKNKIKELFKRFQIRLSTEILTINGFTH